MPFPDDPATLGDKPRERHRAVRWRAAFRWRGCVALAAISACNDSPVEPRAPAGAIIYWSLGRSGSDIVAVDPGGVAPRRLSTTGTAFEPQWSWDGRWIVYLDVVPTGVGDQKALQVFVMRADGSKARQVTTDTGSVEAPTISPDGNRVAYICGSRRQRDPYHICVSTVDGKARALITPSTMSADSPVWSPDGSLIAFTCWDESAPGTKLCTVTPDGTGLRAISPDSLDVRSMGWSPDGSRFAVAAALRDSIIATLYIMSADGRQVRRVFDERTIDTYRDSPTWSPDETQLAFVRPGAQGAKVYLANVDGTGEHPLLTDATEQWDPSWSPTRAR